MSPLHRVLGELVKEFMTSVVVGMEQKLSPSEFQNEPLVQKCSVLQEKLKRFLANLKEEMKSGSTIFIPDLTKDSLTNILEGGDSVVTGSNGSSTNGAVKSFKQREMLMSRANSLKKAMQGVLDATEKVLDVQAEATEEIKVISEESAEEGIRGRGGAREEARSISPGGDRPMMSLRLPKESISSVVDLAP